MTPCQVSICYNLLDCSEHRCFAHAELNIPVHAPASGSSAPPPVPTIVHLSIRPIPPPAEDDAKKGKRKASTSSGTDDPQVSSSLVLLSAQPCLKASSRPMRAVAAAASSPDDSSFSSLSVLSLVSLGLVGPGDVSSRSWMSLLLYVHLCIFISLLCSYVHPPQRMNVVLSANLRGKE
jgi:hypothetical protein